ncbi:hypothetical protein P9112_011488 [Eukaryota sp. TZLM1-RC]
MDILPLKLSFPYLSVPSQFRIVSVSRYFSSRFSFTNRHCPSIVYLHNSALFPISFYHHSNINHLSCFGIATSSIDTRFFNPSALRSLSLRNCKGGKFLEHFASSPLTFLDLSYSFLPRPNLKCSSSLQFLSLRSLALCSEFCVQIGTQLTSLKAIDLSFCSLAEPSLICCFLESKPLYVNLFGIRCCGEKLNSSASSICSTLVKAKTEVVFAPFLGHLSSLISNSSILFKWTGFENDFISVIQGFNFVNSLVNSLSKSSNYAHQNPFELLFGLNRTDFEFKEEYFNCLSSLSQQLVEVDPLFTKQSINLIASAGRNCHSGNICSVLSSISSNSSLFNLLIDHIHPELLSPGLLMNFLKSSVFANDNDKILAILISKTKLFCHETALLFYSVRTLSVKCARHLIERGLIDCPDLIKRKNDCLEAAVRVLCFEIITALTAIDAKIEHFSTIADLMTNGETQLIYYLLNEKVFPESFIELKHPTSGKTLFLCAAEHGDLELLSSLYKMRCRVCVSDLHGKNAIDLVVDNYNKIQNYSEVLKALLIMKVPFSSFLNINTLNQLVLNSLDDELMCLSYTKQLGDMNSNQISDLIQSVSDLGDFPKFLEMLFSQLTI